MILLSLASKQIWPQVLAVAHLKPNRVFLLHSDDVDESRRPAQRLKRLFDDSDLVPKGGTRLELVPDSDFDAIERKLGDIQSVHRLPLEDCIVNFTGGNKLMATAAFRWASRHARAFYLERRNQLTWFLAPDGRMITRTEELDGHLTDHLDPVKLLRCQVDASEVERPGQALSLNEAGLKMPDTKFFTRIRNGVDARSLLQIGGEADSSPKEGDALEFAAAAVLLKLGVARVQRSLRLKVKSAQQLGPRSPHAEIDLLFTWGGKLWLVDCKDRKPAENLAEGLRRLIPSPSQDAHALLDRIRQELSISETKVLKEDLLAIRETGGLLGQVVCVRRSERSEEVAQFARRNHIEVVPKAEMPERFRNLLFPERAADAADLASLAETLARKGKPAPPPSP